MGTTETAWHPVPAWSNMQAFFQPRTEEEPKGVSTRRTRSISVCGERSDVFFSTDLTYCCCVLLLLMEADCKLLVPIASRVQAVRALGLDCFGFQGFRGLGFEVLHRLPTGSKRALKGSQAST